MAEENQSEGPQLPERPADDTLNTDALKDSGLSDPGSAPPSPVMQQSTTPPAEPATPAAQPPSAPEPATPVAPTGAVPGGAGAPAAPIAKKDMTPEQRAAAIKAAQEKALRMKAEREAAKAAAEGGTAVVAAHASAVPAAGPGTWRIPSAAAQEMALARPDARQVADVASQDRQIRTMIKRRQMLRGGVFASLGGFIILSVGSFLNFFNPRHVTGFGGPYTVRAAEVPKPGDDPKYFILMKGYLVNLKPGEGGHGSVPGSEKGGIVALYQKCVHLGCTVPWRPEFEFEGEKGWFRCPCHGSTYTKGGARVFGPAPRSLDTFPVTPNPDGSLTVDTSPGKIELGDTSDPQRGVPPRA